MWNFRFSARTIRHILYVRGRECVRPRSTTTDHLSPTALVHTAPPRHSRPVTANRPPSPPTSSTTIIGNQAITKTPVKPLTPRPSTRVLSLRLTRARIVRFSYLCTVFLVSPGFVCTRREGRQWPLSNTKTFATRPRRWPLSKGPFSSPPTGERYESNMQSQKWPRWALQISGSK